MRVDFRRGEAFGCGIAIVMEAECLATNFFSVGSNKQKVRSHKKVQDNKSCFETVLQQETEMINYFGLTVVIWRQGAPFETARGNR